MKQKILDIVLAAAHRALEAGALRSSDFPPFEIEEPKLVQFGDFSTNFAMAAASVQKKAPRKIAEAIVKYMDDPGGILQRTEIAGPGFINFFIRPDAWYPVLKTVYDQGSAYGARDLGNGRKVQVEFVSANPTGPLHVGHGRGAVVGDTVANLLSFCGYDVQKEYYINDSGRQIRTLGLSVYLRYKELFGQEVNFPADCYQGDYIRDIAADIRNRNQADLLKMKEEDAVSWAARYAAADILEGIRDDLKSFGVGFDNWFSEQSLYDRGQVEAAMGELLSRKSCTNTTAPCGSRPVNTGMKRTG
jgi:Arginyl-tRNA synthetase